MQFLALGMALVVLGCTVWLVWHNAWIRDTLAVLGGISALCSMGLAFIALGTEREL